MNLSELDVFLILRSSKIFAPIACFKEKESKNFYMGKDIAIKYSNINNGEVEVTGKIPIELMGEFSCLIALEGTDKDFWLIEEVKVLNTNNRDELFEIRDEFFEDPTLNDKYISYCRVNSRKDLLKFVVKLYYYYNGMCNKFKEVDEQIEKIEKGIRLEKLNIIKDVFYNCMNYSKNYEIINSMLDAEEKSSNEDFDEERANLVRKLREVLNGVIPKIDFFYNEFNMVTFDLVDYTNIEAEISNELYKQYGVVKVDDIVEERSFECWYKKDCVSINSCLNFKKLEKSIEFCIRDSDITILFYEKNCKCLEFSIKDLYRIENSKLALVVKNLEDLYQLIGEFVVEPKKTGIKRTKKLNSNNE